MNEHQRVPNGKEEQRLIEKGKKRGEEVLPSSIISHGAPQHFTAANIQGSGGVQTCSRRGIFPQMIMMMSNMKHVMITQRVEVVIEVMTRAAYLLA